MEFKKETYSDYSSIFKNFSFIGKLQLVPISILLVFSSFLILVMTIDYLNKELPTNYHNYQAASLTLLITVGLIFGLISSIAFIRASKHKNLKMLCNGISYNIIAWTLYTVSVIYLILFITYQ